MSIDRTASSAFGSCEHDILILSYAVYCASAIPRLGAACLGTVGGRYEVVDIACEDIRSNDYHQIPVVFDKNAAQPSKLVRPHIVLLSSSASPPRQHTQVTVSEWSLVYALVNGYNLNVMEQQGRSAGSGARRRHEVIYREMRWGIAIDVD